MFTINEPEIIIEKSKEYFTEQECTIEEDKDNYKLKSTFNSLDNMKIKVKIEQMEENIYCIKVEKLTGNKMDFLSIFNEIKLYLNESHMIL